MRWAEHWVFLFPLWHGTMPALFKGFLGHIFRPGFAMGYKKKGFPRRPLAGIYEKQNWRASFPSGGIGAGPTPPNPTDHLTTFKAKASYMYQRKYRGTLAYFSMTGNADPGRCAPAPVTGSANGYPDSRGLIFELDYLPHPQVKLALQYTWFLKFNGAHTNYDGNGRNAIDNRCLPRCARPQRIAYVPAA